MARVEDATQSGRDASAEMAASWSSQKAVVVAVAVVLVLVFVTSRMSSDPSGGNFRFQSLDGSTEITARHERLMKKALPLNDWIVMKLLLLFRSGQR